MQTKCNSYLEVFNRMVTALGPQCWWPAETPFEIMVGAILAQRTTWKNVEKAISNLKASINFDPKTLLQMADGELAILIKPSGFYQVKTRRFKAFLAFFISQYNGNVEKMRLVPTAVLRRELLNLFGIGPETADCILLYALKKLSFVVDSYTRRIFSRLGLVNESMDYHELQAVFIRALPKNQMLYNEYHALIVALGKKICRPKPKCDQCPLKSMCPMGEKFRLET